MILYLVLGVNSQTYNKDFMFAVNKVRANPAMIITYLQKIVDSFQAPANTIFTDLLGVRRRSLSGKDKFVQALNWLKANKGGLGAFQQLQCLDKAANILSTSNYKQLRPNYKTTDNKPYWTLEEQTCKSTWVSEGAIYVQSYSSTYSRDAIMQDLLTIIVEDGFVSSTPNRDALFSKDFSKIGISKTYQYLVLMLVKQGPNFNANSLPKYPEMANSRHHHHHRH